MWSSLTRAWSRLNAETVGTDRYWSLALQAAVVYADVAPLVARYVYGRVLDIGAGKLAWRPLLRRFARRYVSGDMVLEHAELDVLFDATAPLPFVDAAFDSVFCCAVLEHTTDPWKVLGEVERVLAPGGIAIVLVPFVFYLHGQPHDYYRFTGYGLRYLAERAGFEVLEIRQSGSLVDLVLNVPSVLLSVAWAQLGLPALIAPTTRAWTFLARRAAGLDRGGLFTMNVIGVLRKAG
jgi:SAM-dependent methyltransferase